MIFLIPFQTKPAAQKQSSWSSLQCSPPHTYSHQSRIFRRCEFLSHNHSPTFQKAAQSAELRCLPFPSTFCAALFLFNLLPESASLLGTVDCADCLPVASDFQEKPDQYFCNQNQWPSDQSWFWLLIYEWGQSHIFCLKFIWISAESSTAYGQLWSTLREVFLPLLRRLPFFRHICSIYTTNCGHKSE